jgi:hypothetical protein
VSPDDLVDISDHGTLIVSLLEGVAPEIKIWRYRVLNQYGYGTLDGLIRALDHFLREVASCNLEELNGSVINLSLGFPWCASYLDSPEISEVESLWMKLSAANRSNTVVVAAAGNESSADLVRSSEVPARWPNVIGVEASNIGGDRACFSNWGNVAAPGGEGSDDGQCQPATDQCSGMGTACPYGLISENSAGQYVYVAGTSYATPLVSGLAALSYGAGSSNEMGPNMTRLGASNDIKNAIYCGTSDGVINVERTVGSLGQSSVCRGEGLIFGGAWFEDRRVQEAVLRAVDWREIQSELNLPSLHASGLVLDLHFPGYFLPSNNGWQFYKLFDDFSMLSVPYDPDRASELLEEAGWYLDEEGFFVKPDGERAVFDFYVRRGYSMDMVMIMEEYMDQLGLDTNVHVYDQWSDLGVRLDQIVNGMDFGPVLTLWSW